MIGARARAGVIVLGGGVPRNWAQQTFPYLEHLERLKGSDAKLGYAYGVRIGTDVPQFGGLSGSTFTEAVSWGKYKKKSVRASLLCDITIALPLLVGSLLERLENS
jgi:deoxyhypusine synthase